MKKITFLTIISLLFSVLSFAQSAKIILGAGNNDFRLIENKANGFTGVLNISKIQTFSVSTKEGTFIQLYSQHMTKDFNEIGNPDLPVFNQMIEIPEGASINVEVLSYDEKTINLADYNIQNKIIPTQPSIRKDQDPSEVPFIYNKQAYQINKFRKTTIASVKKLGKVHGVTIGRLTFNPLSYNPVNNVLKVKTNLVVKVSFKNADYTKMAENSKRFYSPYFEGMFQSALINHHSYATRDTLTKYPVKMVIVADPMFQATLQPYIEWKTKKGFYIVEAYTDDPQVGTTTTSIHNYLQNLYNSATPTDPAPTFVLFVGDINEIPAYSSNVSTAHYTDLYYSCFDGSGDIYPEMYYGRFSADNTSQLQVYIDKTLEIEQYTMPDPSYLGKCVMVAGVDASNAPTYGNGQINYGCDNYFNTAHGYTDVYEYLYGSGSPITSDDAGAADAIHQNVSDGVGFANYTAHCSPDGWADPSFAQSDIPNLSNDHKYCFMIGNCCQSNKFDEEDAFGEVITYTANKGAYAYCGGTQYTYWDEDFWFGVGATSVTANPSYDSHLGAYDRAWHDHAEAKSDWYCTTYQTAFAGNMAVTEAGSSMETYYWEIYSISGDPSIMPYYAVPTPLTVSYTSPQPVGVSSLQVNTEEDAYVAISLHGVLLDAQLADASGQVTLNFPAISTVDTADIVVTKQNKQPYIGTLITMTSNVPYVVYESHTIHDSIGNNNGLADYGEDITVDVTLKNVGSVDAAGITTTISTTNPFVTITDDNEACGNIAGNTSATFNNAYAFHVADSIPDQEQVTFNLEIRDVNDSIWNASFSVTLQAPELEVTTITIDDATGNNNGRLDPGETVNLIFSTTNNGHSLSPNAIGTLGSSSGDITINNSPLTLSPIAVSTPVQASFSVDVSAGAQVGSTVDFYYTTNANPYIADKWAFLPVGLIVEDWETGDFSQFEWTTGGTAPWFIDNSMYYEGTNSSRSGNITDDQTSVMEIEIDVTSADTLSFYKKVSCEESPYSSSGYWYDYLKFEIDGSTKGQWDGVIDWSREAYYLTTGTHTLKWTYYKDGNTSEGDDAAWVDFVVFPPIDMSTLINEKEVDRTSLNIYPNPAKDYINIHYTLKEKSNVTINLYNINGQQIATLLNKTKRNQGEYTQLMMTNNLNSGVYYIRLDMDDTTFIKRLIIQ